MAGTDGSPHVMAEIATIAQRAGADDVETDAKEAATIEIITLFIARMQHHFARGPFSKELRKRLIADSQNDLADRAYTYFLAANVLKHGSGGSYHDLRAMLNLPFDVKQPDGSGTVKPDGLIGVAAAGFFDGLVATLQQAHDFLEA